MRVYLACREHVSVCCSSFAVGFCCCWHGELSAAVAPVMAGSATVPTQLAGPEWLFLQASRRESRRSDEADGGAGWSAAFSAKAEWSTKMLRGWASHCCIRNLESATGEHLALRQLKTVRAQAARFQPCVRFGTSMADPLGLSQYIVLVFFGGSLD